MTPGQNGFVHETVSSFEEVHANHQEVYANNKEVHANIKEVYAANVPQPPSLKGFPEFLKKGGRGAERSLPAVLRSSDSEVI
jgi:hypothetical protein